MNIAIVYDKDALEWSFVPPDEYQIQINYRDDGSLQILAHSTALYTPITLGEWATGRWSHACIQNNEVTS